MISLIAKNKILSAVLAEPFLGKYSEYDGIITFLEKIWSLEEMPSTDSRFTSAREDARQHLVNNDDWTYDFLFRERFDIIGGDEKYFISFLEAVVHPTVRKTREEILYYVDFINRFLPPSGYRLVLTSYFEELPVYTYTNSTEVANLHGIDDNQIPIYLSIYEGQFEYPCFKLYYDRWNDYGFITQMDITYHSSVNSGVSIGQVKVMKKGALVTWDTLQDKFTSLSNEYCSLGQSAEYYHTLRSILRDRFYSFLASIKDAAIFPRISELFEEDRIYRASLVRENTAERLIRTIRYEIEGISPDEYFKFNYTTTPPYAENSLVLNFDFKYHSPVEHRIFALIGKNGTGKTRILSSLAKDLAKKETTCFTPRKPLYSKVFTISYSYFDRFEIPQADASFNYFYCGLKKAEGVWKTEQELTDAFYASARKIKSKSRDKEWIQIIKNFLPSDIIEYLTFSEIDLGEGASYYNFDNRRFEEVRSQLSSGQAITLFVISEVLSEIRFDSLILFDEPETHLHPNAVSELMNTLFYLTDTYESFCIIATHSPLIVQELSSRNVFIIEREEESVDVKTLEKESLGQNLTVITQEIFGNREVPKNYLNVIRKLILANKSYDEIISILSSETLPLPSAINLYIKVLMQERQ